MAVSNPSKGKPIPDFTYSGTELEAVAEAKNYYNWIIDSFTGAFGKRVVEVGAGIGTVSELIVERAAPSDLLLIEPAANNIPELKRKFARDSRVRIVEGYLEQIEDTLSADTIIAVNVMEHIAHDAEFLRAANRALRRGGTLLLLVPALPAIYGSLDRALDHYRRYTKSGLRKLLIDAGFEIETFHYLNSLGVLAWTVAGRILRRTTLSARQVRFYDRWIIPSLRRVESKIHPPVGQSLLVIARKGAGMAGRPAE